MQARQLNILFFSFFIILFSASFSLRANTISQPYGLFFVEANQLDEKIPDGWEDPEIVKQTKIMQQHFKQLNQGPIEVLHKVNLRMAKALKVNFVQTATNRDLFFVLSILLLLGSFYLFKIQRRIT